MIKRAHLVLVLSLSVLVTGCSVPSTPMATASPTSEASWCQSDQLTATVEFEGAAGSQYGTFQIQNNAATPCVLKGENSLQLQYDSTINNIKVNFAQPTTIQEYHLEVGQSLYAQVRVPNGPQCNSAPKQVAVSYKYLVSDRPAIVFKDATGADSFMITACTSEADITQVEMSSLSTTPSP